ncbi:MAG: HAMP domain-containing protein, partial [Acidobacteria bacterium]|nr:HAMP domain-containing protein [Acidobacteriota bacterium]
MKKITTRFALLLAAAAVVPLVAYGILSIVSLTRGAQQAVIAGNLNVARQVTEQIDLYILGSIKILKAVAADLERTGLEQWQQDRILKNFVLQFREFKELTLVDESGRALVSSRLAAPTAAVPGSEGVTIGGVLMSQFSLDDDLLPTADVAVRLDRTEGSGWLVGRLNLEELWRMVDRIRVGTAGYALLVTDEGQLIAHGNPAAKSRVARGDNLRGHPLVARIQAAAAPESEVTFAEYNDERGPMLGVAAHIPSLRWTVIVEQPRAEAFAIPIRLQWQLGIAIVAALMVMLAVGYVWGYRFLDPILALTRGTRALAEGRLNERVHVASRDEIGQLAVAFNNMADRLIELQEDVRKKERQALFGRVSVGLVHDLSHPIQNIGNSCKLIVKMFDDSEYR